MGEEPIWDLRAIRPERMTRVGRLSSTARPRRLTRFQLLGLVSFETSSPRSPLRPTSSRGWTISAAASWIVRRDNRLRNLRSLCRLVGMLVGFLKRSEDAQFGGLEGHKVA